MAAERQAGRSAATSTGAGACYRPVGQSGKGRAVLGWPSPSRRSPGALGGQIGSARQVRALPRLPSESLQTIWEVAAHLCGAA